MLRQSHLVASPKPGDAVRRVRETPLTGRETGCKVRASSAQRGVGGLMRSMTSKTRIASQSLGGNHRFERPCLVVESIGEGSPT